MTKRNYGGPYVEAAAPTAAPTVELTFDQEIQRAMRDSLVKLIRSGDWCKIDYAARVPLDAAFLRKVQSSVNMDNVLALLTARLKNASRTRSSTRWPRKSPRT